MGSVPNSKNSKPRLKLAMDQLLVPEFVSDPPLQAMGLDLLPGDRGGIQDTECFIPSLRSCYWMSRLAFSSFPDLHRPTQAREGGMAHADKMHATNTAIPDHTAGDNT